MIQLFKPIYRVDETLASIRETLEQSWTGIGGKCYEFEEAWKAYTKLPNAHFLNSATSALQLAVEICSRNEGVRDIVSTPMTFIATNHAISNVLTEYPLFADIDDSLCMSIEDLERVADTYRIDAVMFVAMGGNYGSLEDVAEFCRDKGLMLILDASHAAGTWMLDHKNGGYRHIGHEADFTIFSFQAVKNLSCGDGGMLCCKDPEDDKLARKLSWLGISKPTGLRNSWDYEVETLGYKYHGNAVAAAIGLVGLKHLEEDNLVRQNVRYAYNLGLRGDIGIVQHPHRTSSHLYQIRVHPLKRNKLIQFAVEEGIQLGVHYRTNTDYEMYDYGRECCPNANMISKELISLPMGTHLSKNDINKVIGVINDGYSMA